MRKRCKNIKTTGERHDFGKLMLFFMLKTKAAYGRQTKTSIPAYRILQRSKFNKEKNSSTIKSLKF
jgi:hypothetical protein